MKVKRLGYLWVSVVVVVVAVAGYAALTLPVADNFPSTGAEQVWEDYDSSYENIEAFSPSAPSGDGYVMNVNDGSGWQAIHLADDDGTLADYTVRAMIYVPADETNWGRVGIFARAQTIDYDAACYFLFCDTDGDDYLRCGRYTEGHAEWFNFIDPPGSITRDTWHMFELTLDATAITARIDDVVVYAGNDAIDYSTGYAGILTYQNNSSAPVTLCDRFTIEAPSDVEDWTRY